MLAGLKASGSHDWHRIPQPHLFKATLKSWWELFSPIHQHEGSIKNTSAKRRKRSGPPFSLRDHFPHQPHWEEEQLQKSLHLLRFLVTIRNISCPIPSHRLTHCWLKHLKEREVLHFAVIVNDMQYCCKHYQPVSITFLQ